MDIFIELGLLMFIALGVSVLMRLLKQPLIIGYIITGIISGPYFFGVLKSTHEIELFSKLGITILLFIVGLNLSPSVIREVGKVSLVTGLGQILFTSLIGFAMSRLLGFSVLPSIYISVALTFSSTIIIMKLLTDKGDTDKLYGKISIGFLLVQDLVAALILLFASSFSSTASTISPGLSFIRGVIVILIVGVISYKALPRLVSFFAKSQELLFLFSLTFGIFMAGCFHLLNLSLEIGALFAGVLVSSTPYAHEISSKLRPLRDFFITLFFVLLGSQMVLSNFAEIAFPAIVFSAFVLVGNPLIVFILMNVLGYGNKSSFQAGLTVAQISEFSLIIMSMGLVLGHVDVLSASLVTLVGLLTIAGSTYLIMYSDWIYLKILPFLAFIQIKKNLKSSKYDGQASPEVILFGYNRIGRTLLKSIRRITKKYLVVDYNPEVVSGLSSKNVNIEYGDMEDVEFLDDLNLSNCKLVISTVIELEANLTLLKKIKFSGGTTITILTSDKVKEAVELYRNGASYVIMPHYLGSLYSASLLLRNGFEATGYSKSKLRHLKNLSKYDSVVKQSFSNL